MTRTRLDTAGIDTALRSATELTAALRYREIGELLDHYLDCIDD